MLDVKSIKPYVGLLSLIVLQPEELSSVKKISTSYSLLSLPSKMVGLSPLLLTDLPVVQEFPAFSTPLLSKLTPRIAMGMCRC